MKNSIEIDKILTKGREILVERPELKLMAIDDVLTWT